MSLLSPSDQQRLTQELGALTRRVQLVFFTQTFECETCVQTRRILDELPLLSPRISIEEVNFVLEPARAAALSIDRVPAIVVMVEAPAVEGAGATTEGDTVRFDDTRIRFLGAPSGYEFMSLIQAVLLAGGGGSHLSPASQAKLAALVRPITIRVFTTPTCPHCPRAVTLAHQMAFASPHVTAFAVEATEFGDLARRYRVTGVPKTVVDDRVEILGALPEEDFVSQALQD